MVTKSIANQLNFVSIVLPPHHKCCKVLPVFLISVAMDLIVFFMGKIYDNDVR